MRKIGTVPKALFLLVLLVAGAWLAQYHVANQRYYPVSKLASADGYTFHLVQERAAARADCGAANDRFLDRIKLTCAGCEVVYARCERELQGLELALVFGVLTFFLNFIPSIGSIVAVLLPLPIALVQFQSPWPVIGVLVLPAIVQMVIGCRCATFCMWARTRARSAPLHGAYMK